MPPLVASGLRSGNSMPRRISIGRRITGLRLNVVSDWISPGVAWYLSPGRRVSITGGRLSVAVMS